MEQESDFDYTIKLLVVGDSSVGKTNFITMFIENKFNQTYMTTSGMDLKTSSIVVKNKKIRVQLWDTAGQEKYRAITKNLFLKVQGALVVYDITNDNSFTNLKTWVKSIKEECGKSVYFTRVPSFSPCRTRRMLSCSARAKTMTGMSLSIARLVAVESMTARRCASTSA